MSVHSVKKCVIQTAPVLRPVTACLHHLGVQQCGRAHMWRRLQGAGAVWHIWRREDLDKLRHFMRENQHHFPDVTTASGHVELHEWEDPVHSQRFMLTDALLQKLLHDTGVQPWQFEQNLGEGVLIPAGCAHQVPPPRAHASRGCHHAHAS